MNHRWLALLAISACGKSTAPSPAPSASVVVMDAAPAPALDAAAIDLAEKPARTLAELWTKRLASAYLAHDVLLERSAMQQLEHALRYATIDEELATLRALDIIAPVFEDAIFSWRSTKKDERRPPLYAAIYRKLGPMGRHNLAVYHTDPDDPHLKAMIAVTAEDHVCPLPISDGSSGFERFSEAIRELNCPTSPRKRGDWYWFNPNTEPGDAEPLMRCVVAVAKAMSPASLPREAWFPELRPYTMRHACVDLLSDLVRDKKHDVIVSAYKTADLETKLTLLGARLEVPPKLTAADIEPLAADRRTRFGTRRTLIEANRLTDFPAAYATPEKLNESVIVSWVLPFFGSAPDEITALESITKANDGKPAKVSFYRFKALPPKDNSTLGTFDFAIGDATGTNWDRTPGGLKTFTEERIHESRPGALLEYDQ